MAKITITNRQTTDQMAQEYLIRVDSSLLIGPDEYWNLMIQASHKIVDELVKKFTPEIEEQFRNQIPDLVKQMGNELIVKGLKQMAKEDK